MGPIIGVDLGTNNTLVYKKDIVLDVPSIIAKNTKNNKIIAIGEDALVFEGKNPLNIVTKHPLEYGVISEYNNTKLMLSYILKKVCGFNLFKPILVLSVPSHISQVERRAFVNCAFEIGIKDVYIIEEPWAAALGANLPINEPGGKMVVDIGGGITDIGVLSLNSIVTSDNVRVGGNDFDKAIVEYIKQNYGVIIGLVTGENIKKEIGSLDASFDNVKIEVNGKDLLDGNPKNITLYSKEVREIITPLIDHICFRIKKQFEKVSPDICGDIMETGIYLTGGSALLKGIDKYINKSVEVPVIIPQNPRKCVVLGCGKAFNLLEQIKEEYIQVLNI